MTDVAQSRNATSAGNKSRIPLAGAELKVLSDVIEQWLHMLCPAAISCQTKDRNGPERKQTEKTCNRGKMFWAHESIALATRWQLSAKSTAKTDSIPVQHY